MSVNSGYAFEEIVERSVDVRSRCASPESSDDLLRAVDSRIVAELAHRVEIWAFATGRSVRTGVSSNDRLSDETIRELLLVVDTLTRRESARRSHGPTIPRESDKAETAANR